MSASSPLFRFVQAELPWQLGPPDGRYLVRPEARPDAPPSHVIVLATLGAPERRRLARQRREAPPEPAPTPVATTRATVIEVGSPAATPEAARAWLSQAGQAELEAGFEVLNRVLHAYRLVTADPYLHPVVRGHAIVSRLGFGAGEQVADGLWSDAREINVRETRQRRLRVLHPQARLAAVLGAREAPLACEELVLRARLDLDHGRDREAALQLLVALDAALAELAVDPRGAELTARLTELRGQREATAQAAQAALAGPVSAPDRAAVVFTLERIESALRARAVANA
ncbi:MAG: hypothetical protein ACR2GZ_08385 [Solirubrobacteraceae bacterium]